MKAISLWQPWATLMALGLKTIETRSWPTNYRGLLAIHAAVSAQIGAQRIYFEELKGIGLFTEYNSLEDMPRGGIIASVDVTDCLRVTVPPEHWKGFDVPAQDHTGKGLRLRINKPEFHYGDYRAGRYMWITNNVRPFKKIIPFRGRQGLFNIPDEALRVCRVCGCSEFNACSGGCAWVEADLCSACASVNEDA